MKRHNAILTAILSLALASAANADADRGITPKMRGAGDPFPARTTAYDVRKLQMEKLGRGVVAVRTGDGGKDVWVSWRYRSIDPKEMGFNVYRDGKLLNGEPITNVTWFVDSGAWKGAAMTYEVRPVLGRHELRHGRGRWVLGADAGIGYFDVPLPHPPPARNGPSFGALRAPQPARAPFPS